MCQKLFTSIIVHSSHIPPKQGRCVNNFSSPIIPVICCSQLLMCQSFTYILRPIKTYTICCALMLYCEGQGCSSEGDRFAFKRKGGPQRREYIVDENSRELEENFEGEGQACKYGLLLLLLLICFADASCDE